ncbi:MAG: hypothetical protein CVV10_03600 [Gammaproteobacteria bacterium HGW-Gammaproteobacteria-14]|nr:MAG: hypothetical protein CVV10_03600 [Gammaproteobacteria bacterium HGW-Gammaproteobacteria-14]
MAARPGGIPENQSELAEDISAVTSPRTAAPQTTTNDSPAPQYGAPSKPHLTHFDFNQFDQAFRALLGQHQAPPHDLFSQLYDPEAYIESLRELTVNRPAKAEEMKGSNTGTPSLRIGSHIDPETGELQEISNVDQLPATLTILLEIADNQYLQYMLVRWIDTGNNAVIGVELIAGSGIGGSQIFTTEPKPPNEGGHYRVEVFDAGESLEWIAGGSIAIERLGRSIMTASPQIKSE